jgi:nitrous oxide reductase accessory protein NosL
MSPDGKVIMNISRIIVIAMLLAGPAAMADKGAPATAAKTDKCPVCGMFVAKYPDFLTQVIFSDDAHAFFDGAKDMFKYYFNLKKYQPSKKLSDLAFVHVTDYYSVTPIDGKKAWYVVGSDVFGPMGRELIPFAKKSDAAEFMKDHAGKKLLRFEEVTPEIIKGLD